MTKKYELPLYRRFTDNQYKEICVSDYTTKYDFFTYTLHESNHGNVSGGLTKFKYTIRKHYFVGFYEYVNEISSEEIRPNKEVTLLKCALDIQKYEKRFWKRRNIILTLPKSRWLYPVGGGTIEAYIPTKLVEGLQHRAEKDRRKRLFI